MSNFKFKKLSKNEIFEILKISNKNFIKRNHILGLTKKELEKLTIKILELNPNLVFLQNETVKNYFQKDFEKLTGRLIFLKDNFKYSTVFVRRFIKDFPKEINGIQFIQKCLVKRLFYSESDFIFLHENFAQNIKTSKYFILDEEILLSDYFVKNQEKDFIDLIIRQAESIFNLKYFNVKILDIDDGGIFFKFGKNYIIKFFKPGMDISYFTECVNLLNLTKIKDLCFIDNFLKFSWGYTF